MTGQWLTVEQVAELFQIPAKSVTNMCRAEELPHNRVGKHYRFSPAAIAEIEAKTFKVPADTPSLAAARVRAAGRTTRRQRAA
ncbi:helix-turn-helix domain-containing protein [Micromonospora sp. DT47]|uniref:helix-turn-helix domain-containing protein n=1 Tax=Micromonospora sp. DT47 TaxID=3393431 RepID=UPI003CE8A2CC